MLRSPTRFTVAALVLAVVPLASAQFFSPVVDFEDTPIGSPALSQEMFNIPQFNAVSLANIVENSPDLFDENAAYRDDQFSVITGNGSMRVYFEWLDETDPNAWVRLSTFNAPVRPNPSVHLDGKVRFKIRNLGDFFFDGTFGICLGIRETGNNVPQLADGGTDGDIEWVGATGVVGSGDTARPVPAYIMPLVVNAIWMEFDLQAGTIATGTDPNNLTVQGSGIQPFTGDGVLDGTRGTLEHIAIVNVASDNLKEIQFFIDDLRTEAPDPDPVVPPTVQGPIVAGDPSVTVIDLLGTADQVTLYRDGNLYQTQPVTDPNAGVTFSLTPAAGVSECFTATQREGVSQDTSLQSDPVCALAAPAAYTFSVCLDEDGNNCPPAGPWEFVPAEDKGTSPDGEAAPHGQVILPDGSQWQTIVIPLTIPEVVTPWLGGNGEVAPAGTGFYSIDSVWFTSLGGPDALDTHEVFIDSMEALDSSDNVLETIHAFEDGVNYLDRTRSQSSSSVSSTSVSTITSYEGLASHRLAWSFATTTVDETLCMYHTLFGSCGTSPTFTDATKKIRVRLLARPEYTGTAPQPSVAKPIVGTQSGVLVNNDPNATTVTLYVNGAAVDSVSPPTGVTTEFTGLSLLPGESVSATQFVGEVSAFAYPIVVQEKPSPPTVQTPIAPGSTSVTITGVADTLFAEASLVEVYVNDAPAGTAVPTSDTVDVTVPQLITTDMVKVRQTVNGAVSEFSDPVVVAYPAPVIYYVPGNGDNQVWVTGIDPTADTVKVTVDTTDYTTPNDPNATRVAVPTASLTMGQQVVARYVVAGEDSFPSDAETVTTGTTTDIFCDDLEYTDQAAFESVWSPIAQPLQLSDAFNTSSPGSKSAFAPATNHRNSAGHFTGALPTDTEPVVFQINILDSLAGTGYNHYADLNNLDTDFFLAEIGISSLAGSQAYYQARLNSNGGPDWINLEGFDAPTRSVGWHNFTMVFKGPPAGETEGHEIDIYVDGLLTNKNVILTADTVLREPRMGAGIGSAAVAGYFDDYCAFVGPLSFPILPPAPPRVESPVEAGDEFVEVSNILPEATLVTVYADDSPIGSIDPNGAATVFVPVTPLVHLDLITATQTTPSAGEGIAIGGLEVGKGNGDLLVCIGVRETGDTDPLGTPGGTSGSIEWIGATGRVDGAPQGIAISPMNAWQTLVFDPSDPNNVTGFTGGGTIDGSRGVLEHLAVAVDAASPDRSTGAYQVFIDNVINVNADPNTGGDFVITDFESFDLGSESLFLAPGISGSTSANNRFPPDYSFTAPVGNPGQSQELGWFWLDTTAQRWQRIATGGADNVPSPIVDLTKPIQLDILLLERCEAIGDVNGDGVLDTGDLDEIGLCVSGPGVPVDISCRCADTNGDFDVDLIDIAVIQREFGN